MKRETMPELKAQAREVWRLSLPAILTQITTIAMQYIDSAMVGALKPNRYLPVRNWDGKA